MIARAACGHKSAGVVSSPSFHLLGVQQVEAARPRTRHIRRREAQPSRGGVHLRLQPSAARAAHAGQHRAASLARYAGSVALVLAWGVAGVCEVCRRCCVEKVPKGHGWNGQERAGDGRVGPIEGKDVVV